MHENGKKVNVLKSLEAKKQKIANADWRMNARANEQNTDKRIEA